MRARHRALVVLASGAALFSCASPPPPPPPPPKPVVVGPPTDTVKIPLTDLLAKTYYGNPGGLYPGGLNQPPADHDSAARAWRNKIQPLDVNGDESPFGKYVLISIGMSNTTQEWCSQSSGPPCATWSFMGKAAADPSVNNYTLVIVNGAADGQDAPDWTSASSPNYDRIKTARLAPLGLSENQVQAIWVKLDGSEAFGFASGRQRRRESPTHEPRSGFARAPDPLSVSADRLSVEPDVMADTRRTDLNPEPYAYESGFSVKWAIESQINEMRGLPLDRRAGTLNYTKKAAPLIVWGPYMWADGATRRSDGFVWNRDGFRGGRNCILRRAARARWQARCSEFFKNSPYARCWFLVNQYCL